MTSFAHYRDELLRRLRERGPASLARAFRLSVAAVASYAIALGAVADAWGLHAVLWTIAVVPLPSILLAVSLPPIAGTRVTSGRTPEVAASGRRDGMHAAASQRLADHGTHG